MPLQFNHVFAGKAGGCGEVEQDAVVYRLPVAAEKVGVKRGARFGRFATAEGLCQRQQVFAGKADNADAAASGGGGDSGDGGYYLQTLSYFSAKLKKKELRDSLLNAATTDEVYKLLIEA